MTEPFAVDDATDTVSYLKPSAIVRRPDSLIISLVLLLAALVGGYFMIGLDRMDASPMIAAAQAQVSPGS